MREDLLGKINETENENIASSWRRDFELAYEDEIASMPDQGEILGYSQGEKREENAETFLIELIAFCSDKSYLADHSNEEKAKLHLFLNKLYEKLFSYSPNIWSALSFDQIVRIGAMATQNPYAQGWFGRNAVGEVNLKLAYSDCRLLTEEIERMSLALVLDVLTFLTTVAAEGVANASWSHDSIPRVVENIIAIRDARKLPIVNYACDLALQRIKAENQNPSLSFLTILGDPKEGRLRERKEEDSGIEKRIFTDVAIPVEGHLGVVAADAVALFDHSDLPRYYDTFQVEEVSKYPELKVGQGQLQGAKTVLSKFESAKTVGEFTQCFLWLWQNIAFPYYGNRALDKLSDVGSAKSGQDWADFVLASRKFTEIAAARNHFFQSLRSKNLSEDETQNQYLEYQHKLEQENKTLIEILNSDFTEDRPFMLKSLSKLVEEVEKNEQNNAYRVAAKPYETIGEDKALFPFGVADPDIPLLLRHLHRPSMRAMIEDDLGVNLRELPLNSQIQLLRFLSLAGNEDFAKIRILVTEKPNLAKPFLESFLSCADDLAFGRHLLTLVETAGENEQKLALIYESYSKIVKTVGKVEGELVRNFGERPDFNQIVWEIKKKLLLDGKDLLRDSSNQSLEEIPQKLSFVNADLLLFAETFKTLLENGFEVNLEDFKDYELKSRAGDDLSEFQDRMLEIAEANWINSGFRKPVIDDLKEAFSNPNSRFYLLLYKGELAGFLRFDTEKNGDLYGASFNIHPNIRHRMIGETVLKSVVAKEAKEHRIRVTADPRSRITQRYIGEFGFVGGNIVRYKEGGCVFELYRDERSKSGEYINSLDRELIVDYNDEASLDSFFEEAKNLFGEGYVLTKYKSKDGSSVCSAIFQRT